MKNRKTLTILLVTMVLAIVLAPALALADEFDGYISIANNNDPTIDAFTVLKSAAAVTAIIPTDVLNVSLTVSDADTFTDVSEIMLLFWHTTTSGTPTDLLGTFDQLNNDSAETFWVSVYNGSSFEADITNTTWSATAPAEGNPTGAETSWTYTFDVTVGEEALEAVGDDTDKWVIGLKVTDGSNKTDFALATGSESPISMAWYGMMYPEAGAGPQWYTGTSGMAYADEPAQVFDGSYFLKVLANGNYTFEVSADSSWSNGTNSITYNTGIASSDEFSLAVDTKTTYDGGTAVELPNGGATIPMSTPIDVSWGTATDYSGVIITNIYMFLQTNATMTESGGVDYTGKVYFTIVNN